MAKISSVAVVVVGHCGKLCPGGRQVGVPMPRPHLSLLPPPHCSPILSMGLTFSRVKHSLITQPPRPATAAPFVSCSHFAIPVVAMGPVSCHPDTLPLFTRFLWVLVRFPCASCSPTPARTPPLFCPPPKHSLAANCCLCDNTSHVPTVGRGGGTSILD